MNNMICTDVFHLNSVDDGSAPTIKERDYKDPLAVCDCENIVLNDQGGGVMQIEKGDVSPTIRREMKHHEPVICYGLDAENSNSMKSSNPNSGCHETDVSKTLDTNNPDPNKKQGGLVIVENVCFTKTSHPKNKDDAQGFEQTDVAKTLNVFSAPASEIRAEEIVVECATESGHGWWKSDDASGTLRAEGENRPSRPSNVICYECSFEINYNCPCNEELAHTLKCGTAPGNYSGVLYSNDAIGFDAYNQTITGGVSMTITAKRADPHHVPLVVCYDNQTRARNPMPMGDVCCTLQAAMGTGGNNIPFVSFSAGGFMGKVGAQSGSVAYEDETCPTQRASMEPYVVVYNHAAGFIGTNSSKTRSIGYEEEVSPANTTGYINHVVCWGFNTQMSNMMTIDREITGPLTVCHMQGVLTEKGEEMENRTIGVDQYNGQTTGDVIGSIGTNCGMSTGRNAVIALDGDKIAKAERKGGSGFGINDDGAMYTITRKDVHAVATDLYNQEITGDVAATLSANSGATPTRSGPSVFNVSFCDANGTRKDRPNGGVYVTKEDCSKTISCNAPTETNIVEPMPMNACLVRRLLPKECERLMGFPDDWTRIQWNGKPEEECPDAPRYKACGNSMCVNVMRWIGLRVQEYADNHNEEN